MARTKMERDIEIQSVLENRISDCFSSSEHFHSTFQTHLERMRLVWDSSDFHRLPMYRREYLRGYAACLFAQTQRKMIWMLWDRRANDGVGGYVDFRGIDGPEGTWRDIHLDSVDHPGIHVWPGNGDVSFRLWSDGSLDSENDLMEDSHGAQ